MTYIQIAKNVKKNTRSNNDSQILTNTIEDKFTCNHKTVKGKRTIDIERVPLISLYLYQNGVLSIANETNNNMFLYFKYQSWWWQQC